MILQPDKVEKSDDGDKSSSSSDDEDKISNSSIV
jgi:hypothetical protein